MHHTDIFGQTDKVLEAKKIFITFSQWNNIHEFVSSINISGLLS